MKQAAREKVAAALPSLVDLSHTLYANPELNFEEVKSAGWITDWLESAGFRIERGIADLPTAFRATVGSGPLRIAFIAEYDALPNVGHACGHNIIAASSLGAAVGLAAVADEIGATVMVIGTPAEEGGGGKIVMVERGVFEDVDCALMIHPGPADVLEPEVLAAQSIDIIYTGVASPAGAAPG
jgi:amidohydrolase